MECTKCEKTRKNTNMSCRKFATENNMNPYQDGFPHHLPKLTKIEEMLIACICPKMKTYQLKGGTIGYKGNNLNTEQDIANNPLNTDINIDFGLLSQLPKDNSVKGQVNIAEEEDFSQDAENILAAAREINIPPIQATL
eukprot:15364990-Ditylum_brightwellii.AAC.1